MATYFPRIFFAGRPAPQPPATKAEATARTFAEEWDERQALIAATLAEEAEEIAKVDAMNFRELIEYAGVGRTNSFHALLAGWPNSRADGHLVEWALADLPQHGVAKSDGSPDTAANLAVARIREIVRHGEPTTQGAIR